MSDDDMLKQHEETWHGFLKLLTWSTVGIVIVLILMGLFLV